MTLRKCATPQGLFAQIKANGVVTQAVGRGNYNVIYIEFFLFICSSVCLTDWGVRKIGQASLWITLELV
jgi:hypothetical protein